MEEIRAALQDMLGPDFGVGVTDPRDPADGLWPEETPAVARAVEKRQRDFAAGRRAAREAMSALGVTPAAIPQGNQREPVWPEGLIGSISHCATCCVATVAHTSQHRTIGIDIEPATPLDPDLIPMICTAEEQNWLPAQPDPNLAAKQIFSAKEAVYKAQFPLTREVIGFKAVTLRFDGANFNAELPANLPKCTGSILIREGMILSVAYV
ncbi:4'-phosphopantetheinyl transferase superfamily protein [Cognatiyoonia sp. IB215446]|uniref:4'-phosphopantetheinyl transferase family protein n=1 Tax=Cognatiyoonia sp. IB215446 TaxID=3097355 RepID=UPI002A0DC1F5|nr:4'-phosphopantetheinyl transferase superfamily protein [Cognatiyoonia sp. IB215446]MDX8349855.1 4'-phosphopantetheinyl transferase superfamily protein [Cognatiyoonia sp. IB215446]